jgi:hypothetical protein
MTARQWDVPYRRALFHSVGDVLNGDEHPVALKDVITMTPLSFTATILGAPRIGPNRELKRATEKYWAGSIPRAELESVAADLRHASRAALAAGGLDSIPVNTFSYYDQVPVRPASDRRGGCPGWVGSLRLAAG